MQSTFATIQYILNERNCKAVAVVASVAFATFYIFFTGILTITSRPIPEEIPVPYLYVLTDDPIGKVPWIVAYLNRYSIFSINLEAMVATTLISLLVGANSALLLYRYKISRK